VTVTQRPTIRQVAERAGVSRMTVSRVLNNQSERFSEETRRRVLQTVREFEYVPVAQPTTQRRQIATRILSLFFDGAPMQSLWGLPTFWGLSEAARELGYDLLTVLRERPDWMMDQEELQFMDRRSDGLIFIAPVERGDVFKALVRHKLPVVTCYTADVPDGVPSVVLDNAGAMKLTTQHLIDHGHKRILHITPPPLRSDFRERRLGYEQAMRQAGLKPSCLEATTSTDDIPKLMQTLKRGSFTAIVCATDALAVAAWDIADKNGLSVPADLSVTGMDDLAAPAQRGLTTVHFSCEEVGRRAIHAAVRLIQGEEYSQCSSVVPVELVERSSVAPPRS
jgi:DNA-binding LacI/PurR family transcriptional regulator